MGRCSKGGTAKRPKPMATTSACDRGDTPTGAVAMPAITVADTSALPRVPRVDASSRARPAARIVASTEAEEGAGIHVHRPFPGGLSMTEADPFLLLDHAGPKHN